MERIVHDIVQGTPAWDEFRLVHFGGSEIAAVLGLSKTTTRNELLRAKKTGIAREYSDWLQRNVLDRGHEIEALARPLAVEFAGVDGFYPATASIGRISASCDGIDMLDETAWECKSLNAQSGPIVRAGQVPDEHMPQCQQVLMVTGAERLLFTVSDGTRENTFHVWVEPDTVWFDRIRAAWAQFELDLATFVPAEPVAEVVGRTPETLPSLHIVLKGEVSASNLSEFKEVALTAIRSVNRDLKTDQDFADSAKARKWCEDIEARVAAAKEHALSQTASIDLLFRTMDEVSAEAREVRLALEKLEKARKESRKGEIVAGGISALKAHIDALNTRLGRPYMPAMQVDFGGAVKGLRTFDSMQNAVDTTLANAKISASATADRIEINLKHLAAEAGEYGALFPDVAAIVQKQPDDFAALVQFRVADHKAKERKRAEELAERERSRIRAEEEARARAQAAKEQQEREAAERQQREEAARAAAPAPAPAPAAPQPAALTPAPQLTPVAAPAPAANEPPAGAVPTLRIGAIAERLGWSMTAEQLRALGIQPAGRDRAATLYHEQQFQAICDAVIRRATEAKAAHAQRLAA